MLVKCPDDKMRLPGIAIKMWKPKTKELWMEKLDQLKTFEKIDGVIKSIKTVFPNMSLMQINKFIKSRYYQKTWVGYITELEFIKYIKKQGDKDIHILDHNPDLENLGIDLQVQDTCIVYNFQIKKSKPKIKIKVSDKIDNLYLAYKENEKWKIKSLKPINI